MANSSFSFKQRAVFASQHIVSAAFFTRSCATLEANYTGQPPSTIPSQIIDEQKAYVMAAVFATISFLEASINELFSDAAELKANELAGTLLEQIDPNIRELMADMWRQGIPRTAKYSVLEKYDIALTLARKQLLKGRKPHEEVSLVIILRNALTHFEPAWTMEFMSSPVLGKPNPFYYEVYKGTSSGRIKNLEKQFSNPLVLNAEPFFPNRCLCHKCAKWAVKSCLDFAKAFYENMGINNYPSSTLWSLI